MSFKPRRFFPKSYALEIVLLVEREKRENENTSLYLKCRSLRFRIVSYCGRLHYSFVHIRHFEETSKTEKKETLNTQLFLSFVNEETRLPSFSLIPSKRKNIIRI